MSQATSATPVALVHGVGFGPSTFARVARELRRAEAPGRVIVVERRGYGSRSQLAPPEHVEDHVSDLLEVLDAAGIERAVAAGCSGGATIALAAALTAPERVIAAVSHEPAVGSLGPRLLALIEQSLRAGGMTLMRALAGPHTWSRLDAVQLAELEACAPIVAADARAYLAWEPPLELAGEAAPVVCSVGRRSGELRHAIAAVVEQRLGARIAVVEDCGHLVQLDAPLAFAALVSATARRAGSAVSTTSSTPEEPR
jgi:pimeloyl-ACP methyl ester carboxylesterase